jgi:non-canonical (house-cleaning) NTP pyrophosphatase
VREREGRASQPVGRAQETRGALERARNPHPRKLATCSLTRESISLLMSPTL